MKIGENQKVQFIILCCLIAVVAAVGVHRMIGTREKAAPRASQQSQVREDVSASEEVAQADAGLSFVSGEQKPRDPFTPQVGPKVASSQSSFRVGGTLAGLAASAPIPPMPFLTSEPIRVNSPSPSGEEMTPELRLTGVIEGDTDVAIIRAGENARYIVREGQVMDGGYVVESISRAGVRLRHNNETLILRLGGSTPG